MPLATCAGCVLASGGRPAADAFPNVDLREYRARHRALSKAAAKQFVERIDKALRHAALWDKVK